MSTREESPSVAAVALAGLVSACMRRGAFRWMLALAVVFGSARALADPAGRAEAEALFREGRQATNAGNYAGACRKFAESQALDPSAGTLVNLGDCEEHLGHPLRARNYFKAALGQLGASDPRYTLSTQRVAALDVRLPKLTLSIAPGAAAGTVLERDGVPVQQAELGVAVPLEPGVHTIVVRAPGRADQRSTITLPEGSARAVSLTSGPPDPATAPSAVPPATPARHLATRSLGWVIVAVGVGGFGAAAVTGLVVLRDESAVRSHCNTVARTCTSNDAASSASSGQTWLTANTVAWAVGVAGVGVGAFLILRDHGEGSRSTALGIAPLLGGATLSARGTF